MKCTHCGGEINPAALLGSMTSPAKAEAARKNAKLGGWPKGKKRGKAAKEKPWLGKVLKDAKASYAKWPKWAKRGRPAP